MSLAPSLPGPLPVLTAPTAAGKSALALQLASTPEWAGRIEIVAADAFTVYRGLGIGTAKPPQAERQRVPHHLLDVAEVHEDYDVARYVQDAERAIREILARGHWPLIVGGTGFYLSALMKGLPLTPPADPVVRSELEAELADRGLDALLADIAAHDPQEAARMERNPRRVVRALEVYRRTGRFPGDFGRTDPAFAYRVVALTRPGPELDTRIAARTAEMLAGGWPQEAQWLARQVDPAAQPRATVWQALGYREALAVARGQLSAEQAQTQIVLATRQYARRQQTWARTQLQAALLPPQQAGAQLAAQLTVLLDATQPMS